jgi:hypothetical protein
MQVVNFTITLPDETHPAAQVHVFGPGVRELTVEIPMQERAEATNQSHGIASEKNMAAAAAASHAQDEYVLGGYAGI